MFEFDTFYSWTDKHANRSQYKIYTCSITSRKILYWTLSFYKMCKSKLNFLAARIVGPLQFPVWPDSGAVFPVGDLPLFGERLCCKNLSNLIFIDFLNVLEACSVSPGSGWPTLPGDGVASPGFTASDSCVAVFWSHTGAVTANQVSSAANPKSHVTCLDSN